MKTIFKYLKPYIVFAILAPIAMIGEVVADLFQPQYMQKIIDSGIKNMDLNIIYKYCLYMIITVVIGGVCGFASAIFASIAAQKFSNDLRKDTFKKVMSLSFAQTDKFSTGSLVTRITNDITSVQDLVSMSVRMFVRMIMMFVGGIVCMIGTSVKFIWVLAIILPIEIVLVIIFVKKTRPLFLTVQEKIDDVNITMEENVTGTRVIKAFAKEDHEIKRFDKSNRNLTDISLKVQKLGALVSPFLTFFLDAAIILIIYIGGLQVIEIGNMEIGEVSKALTYIMQILMSVLSFAMMFNMITRALASLRRINEVLDTNPSVQSGEYKPNNFTGDIEFRNVDFSYSNESDHNILGNINLQIKHGDTLAILGATGCGKTTLINMITRFYDVKSGELLIDDVNIKDYDLKELRSHIGVVPQKTELFTGSIEDNLRWGDTNATHEEIVEACKIAQADDFINNFKDGYNTLIAEKGASLSGGQKQRIAIARAIIKKPKILIFDDATSALDLATEAKLYQELRKKLDDTTFILIAQRVASAKGASRIIVIDNGKIAAEGTNEELLKNSALYQDIYYSQLKHDDEGGVDDEQRKK